MTDQYAYEREWAVENASIERYKTICENRKFSIQRIQYIHNLLTTSNIDKNVYTVAAAGSLGRLEASTESDADLIVVLNKNTNLESQQAKDAYKSIWDALSKKNIERPKDHGVFGEPCTIPQITEDIGHFEENLKVVGKRLLLLLETQPVYEPEKYKQVINDLLDRYSRYYISQDNKKEWTFLLNDLMRYFRALCVNYQWDFEHDPGKWKLRNIKLRHSRLIMYAGLLLLLGEASKHREDKKAWLGNNLKLTPLERIAWVYEKQSDWSFYRVAGPYDLFLSLINKSETRDALKSDNTQADGNEYTDRFASELYTQLKVNSDGLVAELVRFVLERKQSWSQRFFEYLIF